MQLCRRVKQTKPKCVTRQSLLPLETALARLLAKASPPQRVEQVAIQSALGRFCATDNRAEIAVPPMDNSAMDGYAVQAGMAGQRFPVTSAVYAGDAATPLEGNGIARIFTGAEIPTGADAVVIQEDVQAHGDVVQLPDEVDRGQHIRRRGQDCEVGDLLIAKGQRLRPQDLGLLASQGLMEVSAYSPLKVALFSTGNELREPGSGALPRGSIFNSNRPMLSGLLQNLGCDVLDLGIVEDTPEATIDALKTAAGVTDLIITSGGVSVGEADHVRDAVSALGAIDMWRIAIKPGKPFAFGSVGDAHFIGLPGNPTSAFVTFLLLARPFILKAQGSVDLVPRVLPARADFSLNNAGSRTEYLRVHLGLQEGQLVVKPFANQSSGVLRSVTDSDALAIIPLGTTVAVGDTIDVMLLDSLLR